MQEDNYVVARMHRHSGLLERRRRLPHVADSKTSQAALRGAMRAKLLFAMIRRGLQMELLQSTPPGLELMALQGSCHSAKQVSLHGDRLECDIVLPQQVLLPLLDELLSSYDHFRAALWPRLDAVVARLRLPGQPGAEGGSAASRAAEARATLVDIVPAIQKVVVETVLGYLRPSMLVNWRLHLAETTVRPCHTRGCSSTPQWTCAVGPLPHPVCMQWGQPGLVSRIDHVHACVVTALGAPCAAPCVQRDRKAVSFPGLDEAADGAGDAAAADAAGKAHADAPNGSAVAETHQHAEEDAQGVPCQHAWAAFMPRLSALSLPCADAVFMDHTLLSKKCSHAATLPLVVPPHLRPPHADDVRERAAQQQSRTRQHEAVKALHGMHVPSPSARQDQAAESALHSMPSRRETREFHVRKQAGLAVACRSADVPGWGGMAISSAAACWQRVLLLPAATEARAWEALLSRPAATAQRGFCGTDDHDRCAGVLQLTASLQWLRMQGERSAAAPPQDGGPSGFCPQHSTAQDSTAGDPDAVRRSWHGLLGGTDASGVHAVRSTWVAALRRLQPAAQQVRGPAGGADDAGALGDLRAAIQGLQTPQWPAQARWGDHAAVRARVFADAERASAMQGTAEPPPGSLGAISTPTWLQSTSGCDAGPEPVASSRECSVSSALEATTAAQRADTAAEAREAATAHAWARMLPGAPTPVQSSGVRPALAVGKRGGLPHVDQWVALLGDDGPLWVKAERSARAADAAAAPPPLAQCRVTPGAHGAWDRLLQHDAQPGDAPQARCGLAALPRLLGAARARPAAQHAWEALSSTKVLAEGQTRRCWDALGGAVQAAVPVSQPAYAHADKAVRQGGLAWRAVGISGAWGALLAGDLGTAGQSGGLRRVGGSTFDRRRQGVTAAANRAGSGAEEEAASTDKPGMHESGPCGVHIATVYDDVAMQRHINCGAEAAAVALHARAARFEAQWESWDERWVSRHASTRVRAAASAARSMQPKVYVSALSYIPADLADARQTCGARPLGIIALLS